MFLRFLAIICCRRATAGGCRFIQDLNHFSAVENGKTRVHAMPWVTCTFVVSELFCLPSQSMRSYSFEIVDSHKCDACLGGKATALPFNGTTEKASRPLSTSYVELLVRKSDASLAIRNFIASSSYSQQNGVAERLNRTLFEKAKSMLLYAHAPEYLWGEAVNSIASSDSSSGSSFGSHRSLPASSSGSGSGSICALPSPSPSSSPSSFPSPSSSSIIVHKSFRSVRRILSTPSASLESPTLPSIASVPSLPSSPILPPSDHDVSIFLTQLVLVLSPKDDTQAVLPKSRSRVVAVRLPSITPAKRPSSDDIVSPPSKHFCENSLKQSPVSATPAKRPAEEECISYRRLKSLRFEYDDVALLVFTDPSSFEEAMSSEEA
ncbi:uncharacterized protein SAPINGB_P004292 [Magnusiomyces paraingens]|uniref:Uncharacterized protein n=1 Tax=Magnusiomyces paraingens TaxID=2606893 RepID=A0A5E8BZ34_9ASCO|nr:uncharacterized protein SAPINGB_P004292 [Saprochaete ingens]VVT54847.1 unnamed protein product [Saprochaete ingens]